MLRLSPCRCAYQVMDTPGVLSRPEMERNPMEGLTLAAVEHLPYVPRGLEPPSLHRAARLRTAVFSPSRC